MKNCSRPAMGLLSALVSVAIWMTAHAGVAAQETGSTMKWCSFQPTRTDLPAMGKTIVLISGDEEYRSEEALPMLGKLWAARLGYTCHVLFSINPETGEIDPNQQSNIPGTHLIDDADLVVMGLRFRNLPDDQMRHFHNYLMAGKPVIALRTSTHAFRYPAGYQGEFARYGTDSSDWPGGFGKQVLGETWVSHHGDHGTQSTRGIVNEPLADHVFLSGVENVWGPTDVYGIRELPENAQVLLWGQVVDGMEPDSPALQGDRNDPMMPLAWLREFESDSGRSARIFCTTMGAATDFENPGLRRLITNAALGMTGLESRIPEVENLDPVDQYDPSDFGFNGFRKGLTPADYQD